MSDGIVIPCRAYEAGTATLTFMTAKGWFWRRRLAPVAKTHIDLSSFVCSVVNAAGDIAGGWLFDCIDDLRSSQYRSDELFGFNVRDSALVQADRNKVVAFGLYNLYLWLENEGYLAPQAVKALSSGARIQDERIVENLHYYQQVHRKAGTKMYNSFVGAVLKALTGSAKNGGSLVVQAKLMDLLMENYSMAAGLLGDDATAAVVRDRKDELGTMIKRGMEQYGGL